MCNLIRLEPENVVFPPTYVSSISKSTIFVVNDSNKKIRFEWRRFSSEEDEKKAIETLDILNPSDREQSQSLRLFSSPCLRIYPLTGEVWPKGKQQIFAEFQPNKPQQNCVTAYLFNIETGQRTPYTFKCEGLPASADFNIHQINLGHVCLERIYEYKVILRNTGKIPLDFQLMPKELKNLVFTFYPSKGHLNIGESIPIQIILEVNHVGQFNETFEYRIFGFEDRPGPRITLHGKAIGATFDISCRKIEFGTISYGFLYCHDFEITNTSDIPLDFSLTLAPNKSFEAREFKIIPDTGTIQGFAKQKVKVEFIPHSIQEYFVQLNLDSAKFEDRLFSLPITATCVCPLIHLKKSEIDLGDVFLNYQNQTSIIFQNKTKYPAKFECIDYNEDSPEATCKFGKYSGIITPNGDTEIPVFITPQQLGPLKITKYVRIFGSDRPPLAFTIKCISVGPNIKIGADTIDFGTIPALQEKEIILDVLNDSFISANFTAAVESSYNSFSIPTKEGEILPGETFQFPIKAFLDDAITFKGKLIFSFKHLSPITFNIIAKGKGTAIVSSISMEKIDIGYLLTGTPFVKKFELKNHSRRNQQIKWINSKPSVEQTDKINPSFSISIEPEDTVIQGGQVQSCFLKIDCNAPCKFEFTPICESTIDKTKLEIFKPLIFGEFIKPTITFAQDSMEFKYVHDTKREEEISGEVRSSSIISPSIELLKPISAENQISNVSELPIIGYASVSPPFQLSITKFELDPQQTIQFSIIFNTNFKKDFTSQIINEKITFTIENNPHKFYINLRGLLIFPNLSFDFNFIDFGSLLSHTDGAKTIIMKNTSEVPVSFFWELLPTKNNVDIAKIFDVYPIRGDIDVGESQETHFGFFAADLPPDADEHHGLAICHVCGGPDYKIDLHGSSCKIDYEISSKLIDLGIKHFADITKTSFTITNNSTIPLDFQISPSKTCKFVEIDIDPISGTVPGGKTQKFSIKIIPGFPQSYKEQICIKIGNVDETEVIIKIECSFPQIQSTLPRCENEDQVIKTAKQLEKPPSLSLEEFLMKTEEAIFIQRLINLRKSSKDHKKFLSKMSSDKIERALSNKYSGYVLSTFEVDFGRMTLGEIKSFTYSLKSKSDYPISFEIATSPLSGSGFVIEPTSFINIPKEEDLQFTISFDASKRTITNIGNEIYRIPILFSSDLASIIIIKISLSMPVLTLSKTSFEFESTLIGQSRTHTLQISNPIKIPVEFNIGAPEFIANNKNNNKKRRNNDDNAFVCTPSYGVLPPSSFQNIEIKFSPNNDRTYEMQIPIHTKHNTDISYISVKGIGMQMKINFNKPEIVFDPIPPFAECPTAEFEIINPCSEPITVFSPQYDLKIMNEYIINKFREFTNSEGTTILNNNDLASALNSPNTSKSNITKLSMCIIVNGPPSSGKTTVSNFLSEYLGGIPILSLKTIWNDYIENPDTSDEEFIESFKKVISAKDFVRGFIIDGLNIFQESDTTTTALQNFLKNKKALEELNKNPFSSNAKTENEQTSIERVVKYIINGLSGQYLFHVALQGNEETLRRYEEMSIEQEKNNKNEQEMQEMERLMNMDEEEYLNLTEQEKEEIDKKRNEYRQKLLIENGCEPNVSFRAEPTNTTPRRKTRSNDGGADNQKSRMSTASKNTRGKNNQQTKKAQNKKNESILDNTILFGILLFNYTLGKITSMLQSGQGSFQAVDPLIFKHTKSESTEEEQNDELKEPDENIINDQSKVNSKASKMSNRSSKKNSKNNNKNHKNGNDSSQKITEPLQNLNSLLLDSANDISVLKDQLSKFIPELKQIQENAASQQMVNEKLLKPTFFNSDESPHLMRSPVNFKIVNAEEAGEFPVLEKYQSPIQPNAKNQKPKIIQDNDFINSLDLNIMDYTKRWHLDPGERAKIIVAFLPDDIGFFEDYFCFCIEDCKNDLFKMKVSGTSQYPDISRSPEILFQNKVIPTYTPKSSMVYVEDSKQFNFGPIVTAKKDRGKKDPYLYNAPICFSNISNFLTEVSCILLENGNKSAWGLSKNKILLQPGETIEVSVGLHPTAAAVYQNTLAVFVKDNPDPFYVEFFGEVCLPKLEISKDTLDFDKLILNQEKSLEITLKNPISISAFWRLKNPNQLAPNFMFSEIEGLVNPKSQKKLLVTFGSNKPAILKKAIQLDVMDKMKQKIYQSYQINLLGESFDLPFQFLYPKGFDHLNMGVLKVNQNKTITCSLSNKGKYPSKFSISYFKPKYEGILKVSESEGIIKPSDKPLNLTFTFCPKTPTLFDHEKFAKIIFSEPEKGDEVGSMNLLLTGSSVYSTYKIELADIEEKKPSQSKEKNHRIENNDNIVDANNISLIDFGTKSINENIIKELRITNIGEFPFDFEISPLSDLDVDIQPHSNRRRDRGKGRQSVKQPQKQPKRPKNLKEIQISNFYISPLTASVNPGATSSIKIEYSDNEQRNSETTIVLKISDVNPKDPFKNGKEISLSGKTFNPGIETKDKEKIFPTQPLMLRYDLQKTNISAFLEDDQTLHFASSLLNQDQNIEIMLINPNPVPCDVDVLLRPPGPVSKKSPNNAKRQKNKDPNFPFEISDQNVHIPPSGNYRLNLLFSPKTEGEFSAVFEASVIGGTNPETNLLKFNIEGNGALPSIKLGDDYGEVISFGRTLINTKKQKKICFINDGIISCHLSFDFSPSPEFFLDEVDMKKTNEVEIKHNQTFLLSATFIPYEIKTYDFSVIVTVVENPNITFTLKFNGEGFIEDVIFDGIPESDGDNTLVFRDNIVGHSMQKTFIMKNICDDDVRFQWGDHPDLVFSPKVGHLRSRKSKSITVTFYREEPCNYRDVEIRCNWAKIKLNNPKAPDWDDSMKTVTFVPRNQLVVPRLVSPPSGERYRSGMPSGRKFPRKVSPESNKLPKGNDKDSGQNDHGELGSSNRSIIVSPRRKSRNNPTVSFSPSTSGILPPLQDEDPNELVKIVDVKPEPSYEVVVGNCRDLILNIVGISDYIRYEMPTNEITFAATMMYETRITEIEIKNTSMIRFDYSWINNKFSALHTDYALNHKNPFSVLPQTGFIDAGQTKKFQIKFAPEEVDDFSSHLTCEIPYLSKIDPPNIFVSGYSKRPLCHFTVDLSDYITAGRRHPDYSYKLPDDVRVIELLSNGIGRKVTKKFHVINATSNPYEIKWENDKQYYSKSIVCETKKALVSSGKRYSVTFSYTPTSAKTVESLWRFYIPEHEVVVPFLVVGRILPR